MKTALDCLRAVVDSNASYWIGKHDPAKADKAREAMVQAKAFLAQLDINVSYEDFLKAKVNLDHGSGFHVDLDEINPALKLFTRKTVQWMLKRGRAGNFSRFGLHKTCTQLELMRLIGIHRPCLRIIVLPLGIDAEFFNDRDKYFTGENHVDLAFVQSNAEIDEHLSKYGEFAPVFITNYESVVPTTDRPEAKIDLKRFGAISIDEGDVLRSFGSQTFGTFLFGDAQSVPLRFANTATPDPNDHQELIAYAHFLGVMDIGESRTRFFKRDSEKADNLKLHPHKEEEFWLWVSTWGLFVQMPSDLGDSDEGYDLPELEIHWHEVPSLHADPGTTKRGQHKLMPDQAIGVVESAAEKRLSLQARLEKALELRELDPTAHRIFWHDLESEREALEKAIPGLATVYGSQKPQDKREALQGFKTGQIAELGGKPVMLGGGHNFQYHCHWMIFLGIGHKFRDFVQAIHRLQRSGQLHKVRVDLIHTELERGVKSNLLRKWRQHDDKVARMREIIKRYGLGNAGVEESLQRSLGTDREEFSGTDWTMVKNDCVLECRTMANDSVDLIVTSIPFSTQYEYCPSYNDFGHTDDEGHFFQQMDYLTPELLKVLKPGRVMAIHVKDRIMPGNMTGLGYPTVSPFHCRYIEHALKHGFTFMGMCTITTDVVRENNGTYRLSWKEQRKDGTRMGFGLPEYVLVFRKAPSSPENGYGDEPVDKDKLDCTLGRWQLDAHGYWRSSGDRLLDRQDLSSIDRRTVWRLMKEICLGGIYDYESHVAIAEALDRAGVLPTDFFLIPPHSVDESVWSDVFRAGTLNTKQAQKGKEKHVCPLQFDVVTRLINRYSNPGELVMDPFGGIGTVPYCAVRMDRRGLGIELNGQYVADAVWHLKRANDQDKTPSLLDLAELELEQAS